ncbi:DMT family transporter [Chitinophaga ginsengisoli]|uniref:EamA-like transporter family protein n=1 Tax=Chitinophaga ginsengisoli TaxID=363837 RepID=A0A2P8FLK7_9BACT|nr:DMT family transporter [Chitinophaga ginsengisoli]PSL22599.1 EamA-like transporter family protein [Chitinophaga ginsengisoli]
MNSRAVNWSIFLLLSLTWGSSFILMKIGLEALSPYQVASLRLFSAGIALLPFFFKFIRQTPLNKIPVIILSGILGNLLPAYLFCIAETRIDSALAGILNGLVPLMSLLAGFFIFHAPIVRQQLLGIFIGLLGVVLLFVVKGVDTGYWYYGLWIVVATACYGVNIALVHHYLKGYSSLQLGSIALFFCAIFALPILLYTDFFSLLSGPAIPWRSMGASVTLGILGSGIASVLFYILINKAGALFASMVTYALPVVAIGWGLLAGERISFLQVLCLGVILAGVYIVNKAKR